MTSLKRSENAGPEEVGFLSLMTLGRSEGATGGLPTRAVAENAGVAPMSPNGRVGLELVLASNTSKQSVTPQR
jgi:hypothetical protein